MTFNANMGLGAANRTITIGANGTYTLGGIISGDSGVGLTIANLAGATGSVTLGGVNTYNGGTTLGTGPADTGTATLGANGALGSGGLTFAGGILNSASFNHTTAGALSLTADSTLNLGTGGALADLTFGSASYTGGILTINNWAGTAGSSGTDDQIFIGPSAPGVAFLSAIHFTGFADGAVWLGGPLGEIVPVPEPINVALGVFGVVFVGIGFMRRFRKGKAAR